MKQLLILPVLSMGALGAGIGLANDTADTISLNAAEINMTVHVPENILLGAQPGNTKMSAAVFKAQDYCRLELKDFEFETTFRLVSATVYFTGKNFAAVEKSSISSTSLKPIKDLMNRCVPGTIVIFDEVKVTGPDNMMRTIPGMSIMLY